MKVKILTEKELDDLKNCVSYKIGKYKYYIIYNVKNCIDAQHNYFSNKELSKLKNLATASEIKYIFLEHSVETLNKVISLDLDSAVVINLSRGGSDGNTKCLITALCDYLKIRCVSSSCYTTNKSRDKENIYHSLYKMVDTVIPTYKITSESVESIKNALLHKKVIVKHHNSCGSFEMNSDSLFTVTEEYDLSKHSGKVIQQYIPGAEVEIPFFIFNNNIYIVGCEGVVKRERILSMEESSNYDYKLRDAFYIIY